MNVNRLLGQLRALLYESESARAWASVCEMLETWPEEDGLDLGLDYAEASLSKWSPLTRSAPGRWIGALAGGVRQPRMRIVRSVEFSSHGGGDALASALARAPEMAHISCLRLCNNHIGAEGAAALAQSRHLAGLTLLDLSLNKIGDSGAAALAMSPYLQNLKTIEMIQCGLGDGAAQAIAESTNLGALETLSLWNNQVGPTGAAAIAQSPLASRLVVLNLGSNALGSKGALALARATFTRLERLNVSFNSIGRPTLDALLSCEALRDTSTNTLGND